MPLSDWMRIFLKTSEEPNTTRKGRCTGNPKISGQGKHSLLLPGVSLHFLAKRFQSLQVILTKETQLQEASQSISISFQEKVLLPTQGYWGRPVEQEKVIQSQQEAFSQKPVSPMCSRFSWSSQIYLTSEQNRQKGPNHNKHHDPDNHFVFTSPRVFSSAREHRAARRLGWQPPDSPTPLLRRQATCFGSVAQCQQGPLGATVAVDKPSRPKG